MRKKGVNLPSTLERSPEKAQRTFAETLKHAEAEYGPGERAGALGIPGRPTMDKKQLARAVARKQR